MAEKRMFAKSIVLTDAFLDMPMSARCLYFTLGMLADDDGFVGSPKSIMRQCGASQDDMAILLSKRFVLGFDSGVIVIKHWRINNYLQKDRIKPTTYQEELASLTTDKKGAYTEREKPMYTGCIQPVYTEEYRLVEGRVEEDREELSQHHPRARENAIQDPALAKVMTFYMEGIARNVPSTTVTTDIQSFVSEMGEDIVLHAMKRAAEADKHDWRYVKGILNRYKTSGLDTLEKVMLEEKRFKAGKSKSGTADEYTGDITAGWDLIYGKGAENG